MRKNNESEFHVKYGDFYFRKKKELENKMNKTKRLVIHFSVVECYLSL